MKANTCCRALAVSTVAAFALVAGAKELTLVDLPVAGVTNTAYLASMSSRAWWNKDLKRRAAFLVSNRADVRAAAAPIEFVFDPGEAVDPASVRVVTPWDTEVPCVCERYEGQRSKVRVKVKGQRSKVRQRMLTTIV